MFLAGNTSWSYLSLSPPGTTGFPKQGDELLVTPEGGGVVHGREGCGSRAPSCAAASSRLFLHQSGPARETERGTPNLSLENLIASRVDYRSH